MRPVGRGKADIFKHLRIFAALVGVGQQQSKLLSLDNFQAAISSGRARSIRCFSLYLCIASHRSVRRCTLSQKSALFPNTRARINAVGAVMLRRLLHNSFTCFRGTPIASASAPYESKWLHEFFNQNFSDHCWLSFGHQHFRYPYR